MSISQNFGTTRPSLLLDFANVGRLDPRVTFTRASTATYYDGVTTAKAEQNLLLRSQEFNTTWTQTRATVTANSDTAPDGTVTADSVLQAAGETTSGTVTQSVAVAAGDVVISVFAKPNGKNFLVIREVLTDGANKSTWFNVSTGTIGSTNAAHTATITASTNSYYRCSIKITANAARTGNIDLFVADTNASLTVADDGNGLYLWGAQVEQRSAVTAYTATTTQPITNYVPVLLTAQNGVPRFDHTPTTGAALGLEIEEQRTNLATYSEDFADAAWSKTNSSITGNTIVAPDGALTGDKIVEDTANAAHFIGRNVTVTASSTLIYSIYAKAGERSVFNLRITDGVTGFARKFDVSNGTSDTEDVASTSAATVYGIESVGNGWYRCYVGCTMVSGTSSNIQFRLNNSGDVYTGDGYSGVFIWGAQLEEGAFATSYIATTTTALTRSADAATMTGTNFSSWYNYPEGTVYVAYQKNAGATGRLAVFEQSNTLTTNGINIDLTNATTARTEGFAGGSAQWALTRTVTQGSPQKICLGYKVNDIAFVSNGGAVATDTSAVLPSTGVTGLGIGVRLLGGDHLNGHIQRIAYYPVRLSNAQLQALTG